jgi:hypothetical protein
MADPEKRRLRLMNEVLPEPSPSGEGSPRQRTMANMQRLLAVAAAGAALGAGCTKPETPINSDHPAESAATTAAPSATSSATAPTAVATTPPTAAPSASVVAPPSASTPTPPPPHITPPPVRGYGVVDPMPRPARIPEKKC